MVSVAVIGAGSWGTALALVAGANGHRVHLWTRTAAIAHAINDTRENPVYLRGVRLPPQVRATDALGEAVSEAEVVILAVPSHACRSVFTAMVPYIDPRMVLVSAIKGIEIETEMRISEVLRDILRDHFEPRLAVLSGPSFAQEVARGDPTAIVVASSPPDYAEKVQRLLSSASLRLYTSLDVVGVEWGGAVKNVIAIAAGVVTGLGWGFNSVAALITRGLAEMTRLSVTLGGRPETMAGLAGVGDLVLTCTGTLSRNRYVGVELARGRRLPDILASLHMVAEGVNTTRAVHALARRHGIDMPITSSVHAVLYEGKDPRQAVSELMGRPLRREV
jgi:glycerol-3-phosphate dehydrogenase (NAD(P)+)